MKKIYKEFCIIFGVVGLFAVILLSLWAANGDWGVLLVGFFALLVYVWALIFGALRLILNRTAPEEERIGYARSLLLYVGLIALIVIPFLFIFGLIPHTSFA